MAVKAGIFIVIFAVGIYFLKQYMMGSKCESSDRIDGKIVVITGANTGIGKETAIDLLNRGAAKVYLACRSLERASSAALDIKSATGATADRIIAIRLDLASLKSVRQFAEEFKKREKKLHILINNAGVMMLPTNVKTEDGYETTFQVNHIGHFLLTHLLMEPILAAKPSRVVTVSSFGHNFGTINFDDVMFDKNFGRTGPYEQSKLANVLFSLELAKRLKGHGVTAYSLHPGAIFSELHRHMPLVDYPLVERVAYVLMWPLLKDTKRGAQTTICCAVDSKLAEETGKYYSDCAQKEPSTEAQDDAVAMRLWDLSVQLSHLKVSEIHPLLQ